MMRRVLVGLLAGLAILCGPVYAQEAGDTGLVMGYPASFGILWHATNRIAIRPALVFRASSTDLSSEAGVDTQAWTLGLSAGTLLYLSDKEGVRTYVVPAFTYLRTSTNIDYSATIPGVQLPDFSRTQHSYSVSGSFGAQYGLNRRFSVFGEVGLEYSHSTVAGDDGQAIVLSEVESDNIGTRGAVGVVLYF